MKGIKKKIIIWSSYVFSLTRFNINSQVTLQDQRVDWSFLSFFYPNLVI